VYGPYLDLMRDKIVFQKPVGEFDGYIDFTLKKFDFLIALGGDGTILSAITHVRESGVPILGINLGRLGFLASIEKKRIRDAVQLLAKGRYSIEERGLLYLESSMPLFGDTRFALNDFTILKRDTSSMITIHTYINGSYLNTYWADGIIVATPTGSTGYSLSCGGPIIFPNSNNFVITPVATHNLNVRPVVISDDSIISFDVEGRAENFLCTLDSRFETITSAHQLAVRKNDFSINLVQLHDYGFMDTMRDKLAWGQDSRN
jgi:NAD+ kinase